MAAIVVPARSRSNATIFGASGKWRKRKKKVLRVSDEIEAAVQMHGYYGRKLTEANRQCPALLRDQPLHVQTAAGARLLFLT
jgi:hypothetical protein